MWVPRSCAFCRGGYDAATGSDSRLRVNKKGDDWHFPSRCSYFRGTHPCNERKDGAPFVVAERKESQKKGHPPELTWEAGAVAPDRRVNQPAYLSARLKPCPTTSLRLLVPSYRVNNFSHGDGWPTQARLWLEWGSSIIAD